MRINVRKWSALAGIYSTSLVVLFQFQNCAPAPSAAAPAPAAKSPTSEVRVVDDWNVNKVGLSSQVFKANYVANYVQVDGLCDRHMDATQPLTWEVRDPGQPDVVLAGTMDCQLGGFRVYITDVNSLSCDRTYALEVRTVDGESAQAVVVRTCAL